ncbi:MAG TPA: O-methyltransferase [Kofleriaceae bacterium]
MADNDSRAGMRYTTPEILDYVNTIHGGHDAALARAFAVPEGVPAIQVSPSDGRLIHVLLRMLDARKVVEIGTLVGYSAIRIARGLSPGGRLWTIECDPHHAELARANLAAANLSHNVHVVLGSARDTLPQLAKEGPFDAVFIDADKVNYDHYGQWALDNLRPGGLVIGDNAYLFGDLMTDKAEAQAMRAFHELVAQACESVCAPTPDGMVVGIRR